MPHVILFHHAQGLTPGVREFADQLRAAGHDVTPPDLYDGETFDSLDDGVGYAEEVGFDTIIERGRVAAEAVPHEAVYAGFSLGVLPAQMLAQTRPGGEGSLAVSLLCHALRVRKSMAAGRPGPDPRDGDRPVLRRGRRYRCRPRSRQDDRRSGAVPVPRRSALHRGRRLDKCRVPHIAGSVRHPVSWTLDKLSTRQPPRRPDALRGRREEFQRDVVWITEGQPRTISSIDDTAIDDTESV